MMVGSSVPDTLDYMIAGYVVLTLVLGAYLASLVIRWRRTLREYLHYKKD